MARLKVLLRGTIISEIDLSTEREYIGGRKEGSDIRLQAEKGISREHFKLKFQEGQWQLSAISRFGDVFTNGQKVESVDLQHNQNFQIPPYEFIYLDVPDAGLPEVAGAESVPTDFDENEKTVIGAAPQVPYIKMVNSAGAVIEMLRLEIGDVWVAGRDPACQIIIPDQRVSRRQFEIYKVNGAFTILDLGSVNGTFLNGSPVSSTDPQTLKSGDAISVLDNSMFFELHDPNFKYKVEKIEVPVMPVEQEEIYEDEAGQEMAYDQSYEGEIPQVEQYDVPQQIMPGDSPFTGMPPGADPNQYYNYQAGPIPDGGVPAQPPLTPLQKFTKNKVLMATVAIAVLGLAFWFTQTPEQAAKPVVIDSSGQTDPFSKLTKEQQQIVEENYKLAEQANTQAKYDIALEKIKKLKEILPTGYKDSDKLQETAEQALEIIANQAREDEERRIREEKEAQNKLIAAACEKKINPKITVAEMSECLTPVIQYNPTDNDYVRIMAQVEKIQKEREAKEQEERNYQIQITDMQALFDEAEKTHLDGFAFKAIKKYESVLSANLADPKKLKEKAKARIDFIKEKIREKSEGSIGKADALYKEGKIKEAILLLKDALVYDNKNKYLQELIESYTYELQRIVRSMYQESIIDENYGLVDATETKIGAKDKWKKITEMDLQDGEYFRKAMIKLRRYGVY